MSNGHVMRIYPPVATNATMNTEGIALPQIGVSCVNEALNIIYTCVNRSSVVNNYVPGICLLRINESNGKIMSYYFFSPIYSYKGIIHGLLIGAPSLIFINNNS
ncbi:MAG: hypothetical protein ACP5GL_08295, partial [Infirmifilum sp.]